MLFGIKQPKKKEKKRELLKESRCIISKYYCLCSACI